MPYASGKERREGPAFETFETSLHRTDKTPLFGGSRISVRKKTSTLSCQSAKNGLTWADRVGACASLSLLSRGVCFVGKVIMLWS